MKAYVVMQGEYSEVHVVTVTLDKEKAEKYARLLFAQALLIADLPLENPTEYTDLVCSLMN